MKKGKKKVSKQEKKPMTMKEATNREVTEREIKELVKDLKKLEDKDTGYGCPKPDYNKGMELMLSAGNLVVFRNVDGILFQMDISLEVEGKRVLEKIKVVV